MKKVMAMGMSVLACSFFAHAQSDTTGGSMKHDHAMKHGKMMSMTGCVGEKDGKFMMMNKMHPDGVVLMSPEDLKPHVGHKIHVSGMMEKMDMTAGDSAKAEEKDKAEDKGMKHDDMKHEDMSMMDLKVTHMKMLSEHCDMPKM